MLSGGSRSCMGGVMARCFFKACAEQSTAHCTTAYTLISLPTPSVRAIDPGATEVSHSLSQAFRKHVGTLGRPRTSPQSPPSHTRPTGPFETRYPFCLRPSAYSTPAQRRPYLGCDGGKRATVGSRRGPHGKSAVRAASSHRASDPGQALETPRVSPSGVSA